MTHNIAYFISPHGFGHAARAAAVMQACQEMDPGIHFFLFTTVPAWFFDQSNVKNFHWMNFHSDIGVLQTTPFTEDFDNTLIALDAFYPVSEGRLHNYVQILAENTIELVICDIAPIGILAAKKAQIPSLLIENFTWDWIYQAYQSDYPQFTSFISILQSNFSQADFHIQSEPLCKKESEATYLPHPIARKSILPGTVTRQQLGIEQGESVVMISMGGMKESFRALEKLNTYNKHIFLIPGSSDHLTRKGNCIYLPHHSNFYHPDLIAASNYIIGKAGYSTIAEVLPVGIPFAFINRDRFREAPVLSEYIHQNLPSIEFTESEYRDGSWINRIKELLLLQPLTSPPPENGADTAADWVLNILNDHKA